MTKYVDIVDVEAELRGVAGLPVTQRVATLCELWHLTGIGTAAEAAVEAAIDTAIVALVHELADMPPVERAEALYELWHLTRSGSAAEAAVDAALVATRAAAAA